MLALSSPSIASSKTDFTCRRIVAAKTATPPKIDGDLSDRQWQSAAVADTFIDPITGSPVNDQTVARVLYDTKNIYIAFECKDAQPEKVYARETVRDSKYQNGNNGPNETEDNVEVRLDTFNSHKPEDISLFSVNAIGTVSSKLAGGRANKAEWKGALVAATKRTQTGWCAEMQIPWNCLNYPAAHGAITLGINFQRFQLRTQLLSMWSNTGPQNFWDKEGCCSNMEVPRGVFHPKLSLLPYTLGVVEPRGGSLRGGVDARYTVTPELTAVGSLKPDFSTVEGAVEGIQFSRVERFVPDRRPFFLEGDAFMQLQTRYNDIGAFFYARRIPTFDLGTKLYGKISPSDTLGYLDAYDFHGRNDLVMRYNHNFGPTVNGGLFVGQKTEPGDHNEVVAADFHGRWGKLGFESIEAATKGTLAVGGAYVNSLTYSDKKVIGAIQYHDLSSGFNWEDGYIPYTGYKGLLGIGVLYDQWRHGPFRAYQVVVGPQYWMHTNGKPYMRGIDIPGWIDTRSDIHLGVEYNHTLTDDQLDHTLTLTAIKGVTNRFFQYGLSWQFGILANQPASFLAPQVSLRLFKKLDLSYGGSIFNFQGVTQQHIVTANYELSPTRSFGGRLVTQNSDTNAYAFYHNSGGKGTELFILFGDPNAERFQRKLSVKMVFAVG